MKINLPIAINFKDYHEIDYFGSRLKCVVPNIKWKELDQVYGNYIGLFYIKEDTEYKNLIKANKLKYNEEYKD